MVKTIIKRNGEHAVFDQMKIENAILKASISVGNEDRSNAARLAEIVTSRINEMFEGSNPSVEEIQDIVENTLIDEGQIEISKSYIKYREKRRESRDIVSLVNATIDMFDSYIGDRDWRIKENANTQKSINGMNNYIREVFTKNYWLEKIYPLDVKNSHNSGDFHIHDLGFFGAYCAGWDLNLLLMNGFGGVPGKVESKAAKHLRAFLGQVVNSTFTTQGETAGAQAWSSFDTYCAPFIRYDNLDYKSVKQAIQEFVFNMNVPTRVGFQCPFSNITFDIVVPETLKNNHVIVGGQVKDEVYGDFQKEMDIFNKAYCDVMLEGDAKGRVFTFPIPTINITKEFDWESPVVDGFMQLACKYGIPYFANYVNSDLSPDDAISMCCRLRLNTKELKKRGGGLFGSNPLTGSVGVVTLNLPRIGFLSNTKEEFFDRLSTLMVRAKTSLEIKRKILEQQTENGMYPFCANFLGTVKRRTGEYWYNHFSTIGIVGQNEACLNFMNKDLTTPEGQAFSIELMNFMREKLVEFQEETGHVFNLEATPAEGTSYSLAKKDREKYHDIITAGVNEPYYTNSTQLPVGYTDDIFETIRLQDKLQSLYTGGTVLHLYLGEPIQSTLTAKKLIKRIFDNNEMPYTSITPTFSICNEHGYLAGEYFTCPHCGEEAEVWSRVVGYLRPVQNYHKGKREEYNERVKYVIGKDIVKEAIAGTVPDYLKRIESAIEGDDSK